MELDSVSKIEATPGEHTANVSSFMLFNRSNNTDSREKQRVLLDRLKTFSTHMMEKASVKNALPENSNLVVGFCDLVDECLRVGLEKHLFCADPSTFSLVQRLASKYPEASQVLNLLEQNKKLRGFQTVPPLRKNNRLNTIRSPLFFRRLHGQTGQSGSQSQWLQVALTENVLLKIVECIIQDCKDAYQPEAILQNQDETKLFLSLIAGPCQVSYITPTVEDNSWSTLHADELVERYRFGTLTHGAVPMGQYSFRAKEATPRTPTIPDPASVGKRQRQIFTFGRSTHSSTSSASPNLSDHVDLLYQPKRNTLYYAKNNVRMGDGEDNVGYLALYGGHSGSGLRWTSNELLLQASVQSSPNCATNARKDILQSNSVLEHKDQVEDECTRSHAMSNELAQDDTEEHATDICEVSKTPTRTSPHSADSTSSTRPTLINISLGQLEYLHVHQDQQGTRIVLIGNDGVQYPTIRFLSSQTSVSDFMSALEQAISPGSKLTPVLNNTKCLRTPNANIETPKSPGFMRKLVSWTPESSDVTGAETKLYKLIHFRSLKSSAPEVKEPAIETTNGHTNGKAESNGNGEFTSRTELADKRVGEEQNHGFDNKLNMSSELVFKIIHIPVSPSRTEAAEVASISSTVIRNKPDRSTQKLGGSMESLSGSLDAIKRKLLANVFYTWLGHMRLMKLVRTDLAQLVCQGEQSRKAETTELTAEVWDDLFLKLTDQERKNFDPTPIYQHIFYGGCTPELRIQVWPYLLKLFSWSMKDSEKQEKLQTIREHYERKRFEWMEVEQCIQEPRSENDTAYSTLFSDFSDVGSSVLSSSMNKSVDDSFKANDLREQFHRLLETVEKDVIRCDRNNRFFSKSDAQGDENLAILRRVLLTYIWDNLADGYTQGMCDLIAPILALLRLNHEPPDTIEWTTYAYFSHHLKLRLGKLFTFADSNTQMDQNFASLKTLVQVMDPGLMNHILTYGDFTDLYFSYRWFLLDFKREFNYEDIFRIWETLFSAMHCISDRFELFVALALVHQYRDVIINNQMEFTDILKFFNERAERHETQSILQLARQFASKTQELVNLASNM